MGNVSNSSMTNILIPVRKEIERKNIELRRNHIEKNQLLNLLGILFIARNGLRTRIVRIADKFIFPTSKQYSKALEGRRRGKEERENRSD